MKYCVIERAGFIGSHLVLTDLVKERCRKLNLVVYVYNLFILAHNPINGFVLCGDVLHQLPNRARKNTTQNMMG